MSAFSVQHDLYFDDGLGCAARFAITCDQAVFFLRAGETREGKNSSRERHKGIIGRGHDLRVDLPLLLNLHLVLLFVICCN